jgi:drug/metabolite transporter (DMT)-like permease
MVLLISAQLLRARVLPWPGRAIWPLAVVGIIDTVGSVLYIAATQWGSIGVASVLSSLYPVVTVWLSQLLLAERLTRLQYGGVALALCGVVLLAVG